MTLKNICVFCGSSAGTHPAYLAAAQALGLLFKQESIGLVYGGANVGLMGAVADSCIAAGVYTLGIIPSFLETRGELGHKGLSELIKVETMHQRKQLMAERSDAFIALPGGIGTLEEFAEIFTWGVLGLHQKPFGLLNVNGYYDHLFAFFRHQTTQGFMRPEYMDMILMDDNLERLLQRMHAYKPVVIPKWSAPAVASKL